MKYLAMILFTIMCTSFGYSQTRATATACTSGQCSVNLAWVAPASGAAPTSYNVYRNTSATACPAGSVVAANCTKVGSTTAPTVTFTDTGLASSTTYFYVVTAVDSSGESITSNQASATTGANPVPNAPTGLTATPQ